MAEVFTVVEGGLVVELVGGDVGSCRRWRDMVSGQRWQGEVLFKH